jgi:DNA-binding Xre family transcriptional regulator
LIRNIRRERYLMTLKVKSNLRVVMAQKGIKTKLELSNTLDIARGTIDKIEEGDIDTLKFGMLKKVCEVLGCTFDELFTITEE